MPSSDENGRKRAEKLLSHFRFYIFSGNGIRFRKKTKLKTDGIYGNTETDEYGRGDGKIS